MCDSKVLGMLTGITCAVFFSTNAQETLIVSGPAVEVASDTAPVDSDGIREKDTLISLDRMVVSATRTRRRISETPASVSVISRKEVDMSPAKDINDLIAAKTGVQVRRSVGMGEGVPSDIIMRGIPGALAATRTLILVDGIPTNASGTPFMILNEIPVEIIENIEIVRGPYSSLYGANAFGGVINVVTRKGDGRPGLAGSFETSYPFSVAHSYFNDTPGRTAARKGAQDGLWNGDLMSSGGNGKFHYLLNGGYRAIGNYILNDSALIRNRERTVKKSIANHDYRDVRIFGKCGVRFNEKLSLDFHTRYFNSDLGFGRTRYTPKPQDIDILGQKIIVGPQLQYNMSENADLRVGGYVRRVDGEYMNELAGVPIEWISHSFDWQAEVQGIYRLGKSQVITGGFEYLSNTIHFGKLKNFTTDSVLQKGKSEGIANGGIYLQDEIALPGMLRIVPGIRFDYHSQFTWAVSPKVGISKGFSEKFRLRATGGRAFRAPNHSELYMPPLPIKDEYVLYANDDLDPEYIWAVDAGCDYSPFPGLKLQAGGFYNWMKDLIGLGVAWDGVTHYNISRAWSRGVEVEADWMVVRGISLWGNYVFQQSRNESASDMAEYFIENYGDDYLVSGKTDIPLSYIPTHKGNIGVRFRKRVGKLFLRASLEEQLTGERKYQEFSQIINPMDTRKVDPADPESRTISEQVLIDRELPFELDANMNANPPLITLPAYARTDLSVYCDIGERWWCALLFQNLFDAKYEESGGTYSPGRLATLKLGFRL